MRSIGEGGGEGFVGVDKQLVYVLGSNKLFTLLPMNKQTQSSIGLNTQVRRAVCSAVSHSTFRIWSGNLGWNLKLQYSIDSGVAKVFDSVHSLRLQLVQVE